MKIMTQQIYEAATYHQQNILIQAVLNLKSQVSSLNLLISTQPNFYFIFASIILKNTAKMGGRLLLSLYSSSQASRIRRITGNLPISAATRRYNQGNEEIHTVHGVEERAPSTAEEFERVAEERAQQGLASQTVEKAMDAAGEAAAPGGDSTFESLKEAYKEHHSGGGDFHKTGTDDGQEAVTGGSQISS